MLGAGCASACFLRTMGQASCGLQSTAGNQAPLTASLTLLQYLDLSLRVAEHTMTQATPRQLPYAGCRCIMSCAASLENGNWP